MMVLLVQQDVSLSAMKRLPGPHAGDKTAWKSWWQFLFLLIRGLHDLTEVNSKDFPVKPSKIASENLQVSSAANVLNLEDMKLPKYVLIYFELVEIQLAHLSVTKQN